MIRDYRPEDFEAIKRIHEQSSIDYRLPDLNSPLFLINKVLELDGEVRAAYGMRIELESYLWLDKGDWATPLEKLRYVQALDSVSVMEARLQGVENCVVYLPPGYERFGKRLEESLGFSKPRDGWTAYSKEIGR